MLAVSTMRWIDVDEVISGDFRFLALNERYQITAISIMQNKVKKDLEYLNYVLLITFDEIYLLVSNFKF